MWEEPAVRGLLVGAGLAPWAARAEPPPRYLAANGGRINRYDGPEDGSLSDRCLTLGLPEFGTAFGGSFRRIVQTPGGTSRARRAHDEAPAENLRRGRGVAAGAAAPRGR
jgi:hypothetical protein